MRVWSSLASEASLQRMVGRSGVLEADATLVILWKADEGAGAVLRNSRPLHPPKPARGSKGVISGDGGGGDGGGGGTGAEGHAELVGEWAWVPCFDPDDYESGASAGGGVVGQDSAAAAAAAGVAGGAVVGDTPSSSSSTAQRSGRQAEEELGEPAEGGAETDLARSLGWRSVSTAGDEEEEGEGEGEGEEAGASPPPGREKGRPASREGRASSSQFSARADAAANATAAGASAALEACAAIEPAGGAGDGGGGGGGVLRLPPREALLGLLGKLFQQCSVYLEPCRGDPLVESTPPPRGVRVEARVQLQLVRREERALRSIVQPEVRVCRVCPPPVP